MSLWEELKADPSNPVPQVIMMDGNGILHPRGCGVASHFGVLADVPTLGMTATRQVMPRQ